MHLDPAISKPVIFYSNLSFLDVPPFPFTIGSVFQSRSFKIFSASNWLFVFLDCYLEFNLKDWDNEIRLTKTQPAYYVAQNRWTCVTYFSRRAIHLSNFTGVLSFILSCKSIFTTWTILSSSGSSLKLFLFFFVDQLICTFITLD